jgi:putative SOS response-associated peptidase YedK
MKDQELFSFAGIYAMYEEVEKIPHCDFASLISEPNRFMKDINRRMPVVLERRKIS